MALGPPPEGAQSRGVVLGQAAGGIGMPWLCAPWVATWHPKKWQRGGMSGLSNLSPTSLASVNARVGAVTLW